MLEKESDKTKRAHRQDDPQTVVVQSPQAIPHCQICSKVQLKIPSLCSSSMTGLLPYNFHAHKLINKNELARIGQKDGDFVALRNLLTAG